MTFYTLEEFVNKYEEFSSIDIPTYYIEASCEMIFSQIGLRYRDTSWNATSVPLSVKNASMEQLRFMLEHDIPFIDSKEIKAGNMQSKLDSDYSTLALRMLANQGYLYRGNPINVNMGLNIPYGDVK